VPVDVVGEVASEVVKGVGEEVIGQVHRRWGWRGCLATTLIFVAVVAATLIYFDISSSTHSGTNSLARP